jgi:hypothetical protein
MQRTQINPRIFQQFLDSARNARAKGQSQFYTPPEFAAIAGSPLPKHRFRVADLTAGNGQLLAGVANDTTEKLYAIEIEPGAGGRPKAVTPGSAGVPPAGRVHPSSSAGETPALPGVAPRPSPAIHSLTGDLTLLYPLLVDVDWQCDLFALNPPWDLHWHRDRLTDLARSDVPAVSAAFAGHDGRVPESAIDSTVATLLMAMDRCGRRGEGVLIANAATIERLILAPDAPHGALAAHCWAVLTVAGNPMTGDAGNSYEGTMRTMLLYWARGHEAGVQVRKDVATLGELNREAAILNHTRDRYRSGPSVRSDYGEANPQLWQGVATEWAARSKPERTDYNLWLCEDGTIGCHLSIYEDLATSCKPRKDQAWQLHRLKKRRPMQMVLQRAERKELLEAAGPGSVFRVDPKLLTAIEQALIEYDACRAPLYPLPEIQRLGYLEEEDTLLCAKDLSQKTEDDQNKTPPVFRAGERYQMRTQSLMVIRRGTRPNLAGEQELIEYSGQELGFFIRGEDGQERLFLEARLRMEHTWVDMGRGVKGPALEMIDFTLQDLANHFTIPTVRDVSEVNPLAYRQNLAEIARLESTVGKLRAA